MSNVWAIAKNTVAQVLRMKVALIVILLLLILLPLLSFIVIGDGTLLGKLQTFSSYGISLMSLLLCVLTIAISCYTLHSDLKDKTIYTLLTKPVLRHEVLFGKFLGLLGLNFILLLVFSVMIFTLTSFLPRFTKASPQEIRQADVEFFTSRIALKPEFNIEEFETLAQKDLQKLIDSADPILETKSRSEILSTLKGTRIMKAKSVEAGGIIKWRFNDVRPTDISKPLFIRFKYEVSITPPDESVYTRWVAGDFTALDKGEQPDTPIFDSYLRKDAIKTVREIEVPADIIAKDGHLEIAMQNMYYNNTTVIPKEVEVLYKSDVFALNYFRAVAMIFIRLIFLSALGVSLSTWLSFPVAVVVCFVVYLTGTINGFILESFGSLSQAIEIYYALVMKPLIYTLPKFDGVYNPAPMIVGGRTITWLFLGKSLLFTGIIKTLVVFLFGTLIFKNREIARITLHN